MSINIDTGGEKKTKSNSDVPFESVVDYGFSPLVDDSGIIHIQEGGSSIMVQVLNVNAVNISNNPSNTGLVISTSTLGMSNSYANVTGKPSRKSVNFFTLFTPPGNGVHVVLPVESIRAISERFANTTYGFFLRKRAAYPVVANYVRNTWGNYDLLKSMFNSSTGLFYFQFSFMDGLDAMLENCPWFICNNSLILKKWNPYVNLLKENVGNVPVWVKLGGVPVMAFSEDGLSAIATKLGTSLMLDSYTSDMCMQSWDMSSYARIMIELRADAELKDTIVMAMPKLAGERFYTCTILVEYEWKLLRPAISTSTPGMSNLYANVTRKPSRKSVKFRTLFTPPGNGVHVVVPVESIRAISERFTNTTYGFFLRKRVAYSVVTNYVRNTWGNYGLLKSMFNSSTGLFSFQFIFMDGLDAMLENGPWFICNNLLILKKWNPDVNLLKEDLGNVSVWVKLHGIPVTAFSEDGLSAIATFNACLLYFLLYT
nr:hypothetical protein [Tanacetum cinerariifolium]